MKSTNNKICVNRLWYQNNWRSKNN